MKYKQFFSYLVKNYIQHAFTDFNLIPHATHYTKNEVFLSGFLQKM